MGSEVLVALLALVGTAIGSVTGVLTANKLVVYRIDQLEKKVEKHNNVVERLTLAEAELEMASGRLDRLENDKEKVKEK